MQHSAATHCRDQNRVLWYLARFQGRLAETTAADGCRPLKETSDRHDRAENKRSTNHHKMDATSFHDHFGQIRGRTTLR